MSTYIKPIVTILEYKFSDGTIYKLMDTMFSSDDKSKLSAIHGTIISIKSTCVRTYHL